MQIGFLKTLLMVDTPDLQFLLDEARSHLSRLVNVFPAVSGNHTWGEAIFFIVNTKVFCTIFKEFLTPLTDCG